MKRRAARRKEQEIAELIADEKRAAQRIALSLGICPACFDELPLRGTHECPDE